MADPNARSKLSELPAGALLELSAQRDGPDGLARQALEVLYERARIDCFWTDRRILRNDDDALDAVQRKFLRLWSASPRFVDRSATPEESEKLGRSYLKLLDVRIALRLKKQSGRAAPFSSFAETAEPGWNPESALVQPPDDGPVAATDVERALQQLSREQRMAALLFADGHEYADIARIMGLTPTRTRSLLQSTKKKLRKFLAPAEPVAAALEDDHERS